MADTYKTHGFMKHGKRHSMPSRKREGQKTSRSSTALGYGYQWQQARADFLKKNPLCVSCETLGVTEKANEVDHKIPHKGDKKLFWDPSNWQALCKNCHSRKTMIENNTNKSTMLPDWIPAPEKPLIVVTGRPGAGKTTWARQNRRPSDLVIDLDDLAAAAGKSLATMNEAERHGLIRARNNMLADFARGHTAHGRCILVATAGKKAHREFWRARGAEIVVINTPYRVCIERVQAQALPEAYKKSKISAIMDWEL